MLVVDDDALLRRAFERALAARFDVDTVETVAQARAAVERGGVGVVICDWDLGDERGDDFLRELRASHPEIRALLVSGSDPAQVSWQPFLRKPVTPEQLITEIDRMLATV